jgi:hypothetical protein
LSQGQNGGRRVGHRKKLSGGFVDGHIGGLSGQEHSRKQFKDVGVSQFCGGQGVGFLQRLKNEFDVVSVHEGKYQQNGEMAGSIQVRIAV